MTQDQREAIIKQLNEAETILSTALYQSKQKLSLIKKANKRPVYSEDLIRYAHNISSQHSVASPYDWNVGDPRRPYPTDLQMRQSLLSGNAPTSSSAMPNWPIDEEVRRADMNASGNSLFNLTPNVQSHQVLTEKSNMDEKDVDLMSTDSCSSSTSDSE